MCNCGDPCAEIRGACAEIWGLVRKSEVLIREMCFGGPVAPLSAKQSLTTNSNASGHVELQNNVSFPNVRVLCLFLFAFVLFWNVLDGFRVSYTHCAKSIMCLGFAIV